MADHSSALYEQSFSSELLYNFHIRNMSLLRQKNHFDCIKSAFSLERKESAKSKFCENNLLASPTLQPRKMELDSENDEFALDSESLLADNFFNFLSVQNEVYQSSDGNNSPETSLKYVNSPSEPNPTINSQEAGSQVSSFVEKKLVKERPIPRIQRKRRQRTKGNSNQNFNGGKNIKKRIKNFKK